MISDVICLHFYDRIFCLLATFFTLGIQQINVRAFYKMLDGVADSSTNFRLFYLGLLPCFALPLIGVFDEHDYKIAHYSCAAIYFAGIGAYSFFLARQFNKYRAVYTPAEQSSINTLAWCSWAIIALPCLLLLSRTLYTSDYWATPFLEWATVFFTLSFFGLASFSNPFYDSIHLYG